MIIACNHGRPLLFWLGLTPINFIFHSISTPLYLYYISNCMNWRWIGDVLEIWYMKRWGLYVNCLWIFWCQHVRMRKRHPSYNNMPLFRNNPMLSSNNGMLSCIQNYTKRLRKPHFARNALRFVGQSSNSTVKLLGDCLKSRIAVLNDDGYIQLLPLKVGMRSANSEAVGVGCLLEPAYK